MKKGIYKIFTSITLFLFSILFINLFKVIIVEKDYYSNLLEGLTIKVVDGETSPRGRIYDRNYNLLVDNKAVPVIYYKKSDDVTSSEEIEMAYDLLNHISIDESKLSLTNLKEFWMADNPSLAKSKITEEEWLKLNNRKLTWSDIYYLQISRITDEDLSIYDTKDRKAAYLYFLMNNGYSYDEKIIKKDDVSDKEYAYIAENSDVLNGFNVRYTWERVYPYGDTFRTILGNISNISKEDKSYYLGKGYSLNDEVGISYLEKQYEDLLRGKKARYKLDDDNELYLLMPGERGKDIVLSIDINLQKKVEDILSFEVLQTKLEPSTEYYDSTYVVIQEANTGEILAMSGKRAIWKDGAFKIYDSTPGIFTEPMTAGSIVKGASMYVGYTNDVIKMGEYTYDNCVKLYSVPEKCSWKYLGYINDVDALAWSSNVYQFKIAMKLAGFNYSYNKKFDGNAEKAFTIYRDTFNKFGLGVKTGIDLPVESIGNIGKNTSPDLLLNFAIGQYDTYTTMQLSQYMNTIASNGKRYAPHLLKEVYLSSSSNDLGNIYYKNEPRLLNTLDNIDYISRIQTGFRQVMGNGTGIGTMGYLMNGAGKTGTSESFLDTNGDGIVDTETISSTFAGYFPYYDPKITITVTSPDLVNPNSKSSYISYANHRISRRIFSLFA